MERTTRGIRRVLVVAVVALLGFGGAVVALADDARAGCVTEAPQDPAVQALLLGPMEFEKTEHEIALTRNGQPLTGAKVCTRVFMVGMEAMGSSDAGADEVAPGVYRLTIVFAMDGAWAGVLLVTELGQPRISVPLRFEVV